MWTRGRRGASSLVSFWILLTALVAQGAAAAPSRPQAEIGSTAGFSSTVAANDCADGEVYDDGVAENGYSGNPGAIDVYEGVSKFTPLIYPARYMTVCVALTRLSAESTLDFEIIFYDDDGAGGSPGTFLGAHPVSVTDLPNGLPCAFYSVDVSSLNQTIRSGSVYIGVRWNVDDFPSRFFCADESVTTTLHPGFVNFNTGSGWQATESVFSGYRAFLARGISKVVKKVRLRAKPRRVEPGTKTKLIARVTPCVPGDAHKVKLQLKKGGWKAAGRKTTSGPKCKAVFSKRLSKATRFRAKSPGNSKYLPAISRPVRVRMK